MAYEVPNTLDTLPAEIISEISTRANSENANYKERYRPSYVARIINRSIPDKDVRRYVDLKQLGVKRGQYSEQDPFLVDISLPKARINLSYDSGAHKLNYEGMTFPGLTYGEEIMDHLDTKVRALTAAALTPEDGIRLAAFASVVTSSCHPFLDANGRTAVGVGDALCGQYVERSLDIAKLMEKDDFLVQTLTLASLGMLPEEYNPAYLYENMASNNIPSLYVRIPTRANTSANGLREFVRNFANSMEAFIDSFELDETKVSTNIYDGYAMAYAQVNVLQDLYSACLKPEESSEKHK